MKDLTESLREVEVSGAQEVVAMSVADNGEVLKSLITTIYSQKEKTVVRELMANAFDSMIAANKGDQEIEVYLPTSLDPCLIVRDFGEGMTHDFVMRLYSSLGESTKRNTNAQTGMYGIGSKSPLSITDTFTLRCFDKPGWNGDPYMSYGKDMNETGRIRLYTIFIDENNIPRIGHTFDVMPREEDRAELGGCEVKVPIGPDKRRPLLEGVASQQFCWFDKPVKFDGALDEVESSFYKSITLINERLYLADRGTQSRTSYRSSSRGWALYARQGSATYPVTESEVISHLSEEVVESIRALSGDNESRHIMIDIPIGTIRATLAREALQYTPEGLKNLCDCIQTTFETFGTKLAQIIDDAHSYPTALVKLADEMIDKDEERKRLPRLRFLANLLPLARTKIEANYKAYHDTLPDETVRLPKVDSIGFPERDALGNQIFEDVVRRPKVVTPKLTLPMEAADFPEGKVLLHTGEVTNRSYEGISASFNSPSSSINFRTPMIAFVIPSTLRKWQERVGSHLKKVLTAEDIPSNGESFKIAVIRCGKKNIEAAVEALKSHGVYFRHYGAADMPDVEADAADARTYSKTSVYPWKLGGGQWADAKVEPDYLAPAFYITRVGIAHECWSKHPTQVWTGRPMRTKFSNYDLESLINSSRNIGLIGNVIPIYRVTEKQAETIAATAPAWQHLPTFLANAVLLQPTSEKYKPYLRSSLANARSSDWQQTDFFTKLLRVDTFSPDTEKYVFKAVHTIMKADPTFLYNAAVRWNDCPLRESFSADDNRIGEVLQSLFGSREVDKSPVDSTPFDALYTDYQSRYHMPMRFLTLGRHSTRPSPEEWYHLNLYLESYLKTLKAVPVPNEVRAILDPVVAGFEARLDMVHRELYLEADDTIIDEPSLTIEEEAA